MKVALNQSALETYPCEEFIRVAGEARFDGVELQQENVATHLSQGNYKTLLEALESYQLKVAAINTLKDFNLCSDYDFNSRISPQLQFMCEIAYKLEANLLIAEPSFLREDANPNEVKEEKIIFRTQKRLKEIANLAGKQDIEVGVEFLGFPRSSIRTLAIATKIVNPLYEKLENVGNVIDTFHFTISNSHLNDIFGISRLSLVRLSDLSYTPNEDLSLKKDQDRLPPGEGLFNFPHFFTILRTIKYTNFWSIKVFDDNKLEKSIIESVKKACDYIRKLGIQ